MLMQRISTALILAALFLFCLFSANPVYFIVFGFVGITVAIWEWSALSGVQTIVMRVAYSGLVIALFIAIGLEMFVVDPSQWLGYLQPILFVALFFWLLIFSMVIRFPNVHPLLMRPPPRLIYGFLMLGALWVSLVFLRLHSHGQFWLIYIVSIVSVSDIGAYFFGKKYGKRKLAPKVSPGKSWEGFFGGILCAQILAVVFYHAHPEKEAISMIGFLLIALLMSSLSVFGDLSESMIKRVAKQKDSGSILPGHGGVLDRIDGLLPVAPFFALSILCLGW